MPAPVRLVSKVNVPVEDKYIEPLVVDSVISDRGEVRDKMVKAPFSVDKVAVPKDPDSVPVPVCNLIFEFLALVSSWRVPADFKYIFPFDDAIDDDKVIPPLDELKTSAPT